MRHLLFCLALIAGPATAQEFQVQVTDGNPFDRLTLTNTGCPLYDVKVQLNLTTSVAGVIFDTEAGAPGVGVTQPITVEKGSATLSDVKDGGVFLVISANTLPTDESISIKMDIDDVDEAQPARQIVVQGAEIAGATVNLNATGIALHTRLDNSGRAVLMLPDQIDACPSS